MTEKIKNRTSQIIKSLNVDILPFKVDVEILTFLGRDIATNLKSILSSIDKWPELKWCLSTIKRAKVFTIIYQGNEMDEPIYKEEVAKRLPEYSYKTIATIIDDGCTKGYFVSLDPYERSIKDKKIKNIRPSLELITAFYNWNFERISSVTNLVKKYNK
tara:strand:- start:228 stop:704 length:477 start_codon:yes stop_codon:yes gene_type:complete